MSSASYPIVTGSKKGIQLDPRTKLLLLLTNKIVYPYNDYNIDVQYQQ